MRLCGCSPRSPIPSALSIGCLLIAFPLCCRPALRASEIPSIAVFLDFEEAASSGAVASMKREIAKIMAPSGLNFTYRLMSQRVSGESFPDLVVLKFKGACQAVQPATYSELGPEPEGTPLAFTVVSDGLVLPFSDVECDTIRKYIAPHIHGSQTARDNALGIALGRVVAHELFHIFAKTTEHAQRGVARSSHSRGELTAGHFHFTAHETQLLHDLKAVQLRPLPPNASVDLGDTER